MSKQSIIELIQTALAQCQQAGILPAETEVEVGLTHSRDPKHGDYASNIALLLAKTAGLPPRVLAKQIVEALPASDLIKQVEIAGPGFINFYVKVNAANAIINDILIAGAAYGQCNHGQGQRINLEFVSANPTGPLHVGHGRGAAYGACVGNLLSAIGYQVHREYYVNDAGRQVNILAISVWLRYLEQHGAILTFPKNGYQGDYIADIARALSETYHAEWVFPVAEVFANVPPDEILDEQGTQGNKESHIDGLIVNAQALLGAKRYATLVKFSLNPILEGIKQDLVEFGVTYDTWFSEQNLVDSGALTRGIHQLQEGAHTYQKDGHTWFAATTFGDEKDRVIVRQNGQPTYFASDVAYHLDKLARGASQLINVLGADHHGYVPRLKAALQATGHDPNQLTVLLVQFANLYRGDEKVQMSTRSGSFVTLRELYEEIGVDAARFFYILRKSDQHMDFDLELAKRQSNDNPVYYIQYVHARIVSIFERLAQKQLSFDQEIGLAHLALLTTTQAQGLIRLLTRYAPTVLAAARFYEPHRLAQYLRDIATAFHSYYNNEKVLVEDDVSLRSARLCLCKATQQIIANGLHLLGVSAPQHM